QQKSLSVNVQGESQLDANPDLLKIVLSNLIRNAFQYAEHGEVGIEIAGKSVCISNAANYQGRQSSGFGLGLELVKRICQTQLWGFDFAAKDGMVFVTVEFEKQKVLKA
ncbi:sensor histidine kinase, partial [Vibrio nigripulchritudo ATCC 27043]|uniref:sensor histidine kinase n=1 Tax=Vibrio nigripulchritudo TaxID=28173 RepID=UPI00021C3166